MCVCSALVLVRPNGHLLSPELGSSSFSGGAGTSGVIRTGLYPRSTPSTALYYTNSTPRVNAADLTQPSLQAGQHGRTSMHVHSAMTKTCRIVHSYVFLGARNGANCFSSDANVFSNG